MFKDKKNVTAKLVREYFNYSPCGRLIVKKKLNLHSKTPIGSIINLKGSNVGYVRIRLNGVQYLVHRLIWLLNYDYLPEFIDHINGDTCDNRIENLREVTRSMNLQNSKVHRAGRPIGVYFNKQCKKWRAQSPKWYNGKFINNKHIGLFDTMDEAGIAVREFCEAFA